MLCDSTSTVAVGAAERFIQDSLRLTPAQNRTGPDPEVACNPFDSHPISLRL